MAFRRSAPFRGRSNNSPSRFRRRALKPPVAPRHWQACNFFSSQVIEVNEETATFILAVELVKIINHLTDDTGSAPLAVKMAGAYRRIEIGGIVFQHGWGFQASNNVIGQPGFSIHQDLLVIDNLLPGDAFPSTAAEFDWTRNQVPINTAPTTNDEEQDSAARILWRNTNVVNHTSTLTGLNDQASGAVRNTSGARSLRLRRFLDDRTGLYWIHQVHVEQSELTWNLDTSVWVSGTFYWRARMS